MSSAHVEAISALEELRNALLRFKSEAQSALDAARMETKRTQEWLQERLYHWQKEVHRRERILQEAQAALRTCESRTYRDSEGRVHVPNCSLEQENVTRAKRFLEEAEKELRTVTEHKQRVEGAAARYELQSLLLMRKLDSDLNKATQLLEHSVTVLSSYTDN